MTEKHIGKVVQVTGPVLDIRYKEGELPALLNAIEIDINGHKLIAEVAQQIGDDVVRCIAMSSTDLTDAPVRCRQAAFLLTPHGYRQVRCCPFSV